MAPKTGEDKANAYANAQLALNAKGKRQLDESGNAPLAKGLVTGKDVSGQGGKV